MSQARPPLWLLAFANFAIGMGAFGVIGLLTPVAGAFAISPSGAGWMMSIYAMVYAVASPVLVALTGAIDRARLLVGGLIAFVAGALLAAVAPSFDLLLGSRGLMAVGAGLVTPVGASIGVAMSPLEHRGRALAIIFGGLTLAQALGVPAAAWLGYAFGWRLAFLLIAGMTAAAATMLWRGLPRGIAVPRTSLRTLVTVLGSAYLVVAVGFTALFLGGAYVLFTFLAPFAEARHGLGRDGVTMLLLAFGLGAVVGNGLGGWLTDRIGADRTLLVLGLAQASALILATIQPLPVVGLFGIIAIWSVACWAFMVPQQARLAALAPSLTPVLFALNAAAIYLGGSIGSLAGGAVLPHFGFSALGPTGALLVLIALATLPLVPRLRPLASA